MSDIDDRPDRLCLVGGHPHDGDGTLCARHTTELQDTVADVARMTRELGYHLIPGSAVAGEKVSTSRTGSPTPARLDVLSLIGPGGADVRRDARNLAPLVRRWSTVHRYTVDTPAGPVERDMRVWHAEMVTAGPAIPSTCRCGDPAHDGGTPTGTPTGRPVLRMDDDQVGAVPPAEWADTWVRRWRLILQDQYRWIGHARPGGWVDYTPTYTDADQDKRLTRAGLGEMVRISRGMPNVQRAVAAFLAIRVAYADAHRAVGNALLGIRRDGADHVTRAEDALAGARPPTVAHDTAGVEWAMRYGTARTAAAVEVDAHYLATWLPQIALVDDPDQLADLAGFTAELRALHKELQHVLGETKDEQWLGRCPVVLLDERGEPTGRVCGAGLWHDPHRPHWRIACPRCHSSWPEVDWLALAARIRHAWPIDTRRRYTAADRRTAELAASMPTCRGCDRTMAVDWRPSPVRGDREPMWRPLKLLCPAGCLAGGMAAA